MSSVYYGYYYVSSIMHRLPGRFFSLLPAHPTSTFARYCTALVMCGAVMVSSLRDQLSSAPA